MNLVVFRILNSEPKLEQIIPERVPCSINLQYSRYMHFLDGILIKIVERAGVFLETAQPSSEQTKNRGENLACSHVDLVGEFLRIV